MQSSVLSSALDATTSKHLTKGERRYPCGFPGCKWIFTRSNHVLRHHQRVHPGYSPSGNSTHTSSNSGTNIASISGGNGTSTTTSSNSGGGALAASALTNNNAKDIAIAAVAAAAQAAATSATDSPVHQTLMQLQQQQMLLSLMSAALPLEQQLLLLSAATAASTPHAASPIAAATSISSSERKRSVLSLLDHSDRLGDSHKEPVTKKVASNVKNVPVNSARAASPVVTSVVLEEDEDEEEGNTVETNGSAIEAGENLEGTTAIEEADDEANDEDEDESLTSSQTLEPEILLEVDENQEWRPSDEQTVTSSIGVNDDPEDSLLSIRSMDGSLLSQSLALGSAAVRPRPYVCDVPLCDKRYTKHSHLVRHKVETHKLVKLSNHNNHSSNVQLSSPGNSNCLSSKVLVPMTSVTTSDSSAPVPPPLNLAERPFVCNFPGCRWSFKRQYHLDRHLLTHQESPNRPSNSPGTTNNINSNNNSTSNNSTSNSASAALVRPLVPISTSVTPSASNATSGATGGAIKYACNHPGCGIKVQSETSLEAHVYLTHILSNRNRTNRDQMSSSQSLSLLASLAQRRKQQQQHQQQLQQQQQLAAQQLQQHEAGLPPEGLLGRSFSPPSTQATLLSPISGQSNGSNSSDGISKKGARMEVEKALFTCDMPGCDKRFGRNCELTRHKLNHMDVWPFSCDYPGCGRKFKRKDVFKNHQRTHVKEPSSLLPSCVVIEPDSGEL